MYRKYLKRVLDIIISLVVLTVLAIPAAIMAILIKLDSPGTVFFNQERVGKDGKRFLFLKFRTMVTNAMNVGAGVLVEKNDPRVTTTGKVLRKFSLDEIPQFVNVLFGDMSVIGPRPALKYQVDKYNDFQRRRLLVKPGITGWAQVNGRNSIPWDKRIEYDVEYVEDLSFLLDCKILIKTIPAIFSKRDIVAKFDYWKDK